MRNSIIGGRRRDSCRGDFIQATKQQVLGLTREITQFSSPRPDRTGTPDEGLNKIRTLGPQVHKLPFKVMWVSTMLTAVTMAFINFCTIWVLSFVVEGKFKIMQAVIDEKNLTCGVITLVGIVVFLAAICSCLVTFVAPSAGSSGAPENKGWLNGNNIPGLFTWNHLVVRGFATLLANAAGYPVGREGPTVTMGSNIAFLITDVLAKPYVKQWVHIDNVGSTLCTAALVIDEERFEHAKRIVCGVGGACGMAMLFDSPIGGIVYMFEEISAASWPLELTFRAFAGTSACSLISRALLNLCGTSTKAFVVYEWYVEPQPWFWSDLPWFIVLAAFLGPFSAYHTNACLGVGRIRQRLIGSRTYAKMADAIIYAALCALTVTMVSLLAKCYPAPSEGAGEFVRYNCEEGHYNPVASLLLTTSEGAVKRLFSRQNENEIHAPNEFYAFLAYSALNICLTGVPVPSGNFTGSMLIGGLAGRIMGAFVRQYGEGIHAVSGVYAMVGSAAMLCGFKQMAVAVVVFITGCANDLNLIPPLMLSITVSLLLNQLINERGFDEEQILRKNIPFLPPEPPRQMDRKIASDLGDSQYEQAVLPPEASLQKVRQVLGQTDVSHFPVVRDDKVCIGFTTRARLEAALRSREDDDEYCALTEEIPPLVRIMDAVASSDGEEQLGTFISSIVGWQSSLGGTALLPVARLAETCPFTILEGMPAPRVYPLFSKAGARAACILSEAGEFRGMITRAGLIAATRRVEEEEKSYEDEEQEEEGRCLVGEQSPTETR